jgi:hypothetical protein
MEDELAGYITSTEEMRNAYILIFRQYEGKELFWRPARRWEDHIKKYIKEMLWYGLDSCV